MIRFDLRPEEYRKGGSGNGRKVSKRDPVGFLLSFGMVLLMGASLFLGGYTYMTLQQEGALLQSKKARLRVMERQAKALNTELKRVQEQEKAYAAILGLLKAELPSLEVLAAIEGSLPKKVWLDSVNITLGNLSMQGEAFSEADVVEFGNRLGESSIIESVVVPRVSRGSGGSGKVVRFVLDCTLREITAVTLSKGGL